MKWLESIFKFYLYCNIHIALCAAFLCIETFILFKQPLNWRYIIFVFCSTIVIYGVHRLEGLKRIKSKFHEDITSFQRFKEIQAFQQLLIILIGGAALTCCYLFFQLSLLTIIRLFPIGIISIAYVIPLFGNNKRLRDYNFIKIFVLAIVWASLSIVPILINSDSNFKYILLLEHFLFFVGITIPFDIRDALIDRGDRVASLGNFVSSSNSYLLSFLFLGLAFSSIILSFYLEFINTTQLISYLIAYVLTVLFIQFSKKNNHDYVFTGLIDGTIGLRAIILIIFTI